MTATIFLTHTPEMRRNYYGERALAGLAALGPVRFHEGDAPLTAPSLIDAARGCEIIVSDRQTPGEAAIFGALPDLVAFVRCAVDIRNIAVPAASENGVLVTQASAGFVPAVAELVLGFMIDLGRHVTSAAASYHAGAAPTALRGRQLRGSTLGIIGYGAIGRYLADLGLALGMTVLVSDPHATVTKPGLVQTALEDLLARADFVVCLAVATEATENLMNAAAFARMQRSAYFINVSRGNLVDEAALEHALAEHRIAGAALDVGRAPDQMPSLHLARRGDIIATPHVGGLTPQAIEHQALETVAQAAEIIKGKAPAGAVNTDRATRLARLRRQRDPIEGTPPMSDTAKTPRLQAPPGTCDTHMHIYESRFAMVPGAVKPPEAPVAAYRAVRARLGLDRAVIVQPNAYGKDNSCTLEAIAALGLDKARGIAVIDRDTTDAEIERLTRSGIRGIRFHLLPKGYLGWNAIEELSARVQGFGWHSQIQLDGRTFPEREALLKRLPGTVVVDHVGRFHDPVPVDHPSFKTLQRLIDTGRFWVKLSAPYESMSREGPPHYRDVGALAKALAAQAPERMLWASNWPHPGQSLVPDDADMLDLLLDWVPDEATRHKILVDNPARLYGF